MLLQWQSVPEIHFQWTLNTTVQQKNKLCTLLIALECKQDTHKTNPESLQPEACITHYPYIPTPLSLEIHSSSSHTFVSNQKYICFSWCEALSKWLPPALCVHHGFESSSQSSAERVRGATKETDPPDICTMLPVWHTGDTDICTEIFMGTLSKGSHTLGELQRDQLSRCTQILLAQL